MKNEETVFSKHTPTAFIVVSPLQLLCAIEAESEFEIQDCVYVVVLRPNWPRNKQMLTMARSFKLNFVEVQQEDISFEDMKNSTGFFADNDNLPKVFLKLCVCLNDFTVHVQLSSELCTASRPNLGLQHAMLTAPYSAKAVNAQVHKCTVADFTK